MQRSGRFGLVTWQKVVLWIAALACAWRFLQSPVVFDAILNFYAAGEIPGTDMVLSPDTVLRAVFIICVTGAVAIFWKLFVFGLIARAAGKLRQQKQALPAQRKHAPVAVPVPVATPVTVVPAATPPAAEVTSKPTRPPVFKPFIIKAAAVLRQQLNRLRAIIRTAWQAARPRLVAALAFARRHGMRAGRFAARMARIAAAFVAVTAVQLWQWAEPRIRAFDAWLEVRLNQNELSSTVIDFVRRMAGFATELWKKAIALADSRRAKS